MGATCRADTSCPWSKADDGGHVRRAHAAGDVRRGPGRRRHPPQRPAVGRAAQFAVSSTGVLVPSRTGADITRTTWCSCRPQGRNDGLEAAARRVRVPRVSPDGRSLAIETNDGKQSAISVFELSEEARCAASRSAATIASIWSGDSRRVVFQSDREGDRGLFWRPVTGGTAERLTRPGANTAHVPESWSPTSDAFLFSAVTETETSLWVFSMRDRQASRFPGVTSLGAPTDATFSPDGRWVAYQVAHAGSGEATTYVQPFPPTGSQ